MSGIPMTINLADVLGRQIGEALRSMGVVVSDDQVAEAVKIAGRQTVPQTDLWRIEASNLFRTPSEREAVRKAIKEGKDG